MRFALSAAVAAVSLLALAACGETSAPDGVNTQDANAAPDTAETAVASATEELEKSIPAPLRGSWGMVDADCTSQAGDAKGLLKINSNSLVFYESVGKLDQVMEREADRLVAKFAFTGEGMDWSRTETLTLDGTTLTRSTDAGDAQGPFTYQRCG